MASGGSGYPLYVYYPDGQIDRGGIPDRLKHHPELQRRGIVLWEALKPV